MKNLDPKVIRGIAYVLGNNAYGSDEDIATFQKA